MSTSCRHLRNKKMFMPVSAETESTQPAPGYTAESPCHYWCNRTLTEAGLDDQPVHPDRCQPGRSCFEE